MRTRTKSSPWLCVVLLALCATAAADDALLIRMGEFLPSETVETIDGEAVKLRGRAPATIVHVFSCGSEVCGEALGPLENIVWKPLREDGLRLVAIGRDATVDDLVAVREEFGLTFPLVPDADRRIASLLVEDGRGVPRTFVFDGNGRLVYHHGGYRAGREAEWRLVAGSVLRGHGVPEIVEEARRAARAPSPGNDREADFVGTEAPELHVEEWINAPPANMDGKYRLYEFWATWCAPCRMVMPKLETLAKAEADRLVILSVSDEDPETVRRFVEQQGFTYPIGTDTQGRTKRAMGVMGIPAAFLVNPDGEIVWQGHPIELESGGLLGQLLQSVE